MPPTSQCSGRTSAGELAILLYRYLFGVSKISSTTRYTCLFLILGWSRASCSKSRAPAAPPTSSKCDFPSETTTITTGTLSKPRNPYCSELSRVSPITSNPLCAYVAATLPLRSRPFRARLMSAALFLNPNPICAMFLYVTAATCMPSSPLVK